jgi:ElaB/YqjD/DUF883 family membrane-anchored ribosome-binding protein
MSMAEQGDSNVKSDAEKDLAVQIEQLRKDVSGIANSLNELGKAKTDEMAGRASDKASKITAAGRRQVEELAGTVGDIESEAARCVRAKPFQSVAIAAALGLVVGILTRRS